MLVRCMESTVELRMNALTSPIRMLLRYETFASNVLAENFGTNILSLEIFQTVMLNVIDIF